MMHRVSGSASSLMRWAGSLALLAACLGLSACGERTQDKAARLKASDVQPWKGVSDGVNPAYSEAGWTPGDRNAWQTQLRNRAQAQNEYQRSPASPVGQQ